MSLKYIVPGASGVSEDISRIPQADRLKLATLLIRDIDQTTCIPGLVRLSAHAMAVKTNIIRDDYLKDCG